MINGKNTLAFIPVRGGSKSIPLKNIKLFCGKPLVYWNIYALQNTEYVDKIVVASDSEQIKEVVRSFNFSKVEIYNRNAENAKDSASTESVMLEYINNASLDNDTVFMLVQATSPLTQSKDFVGGLRMYASGQYDSILTCVRNYRFFWNKDGTSKNYDYKNRPRRQDFEGTLMENGAFYINSVKNIKDFGNRLSGKIGISECPEYTGTEIDAADDWIILENLMKRHILKNDKVDKPNIKMFLSDCDGCLTDGGMYYSENGDELKKFNTKDGMAFKLLREAGIITGVVTGEKRELNIRRAKKLHIDIVEQGVNDKLSKVKELCNKYNVSLENVAYIGDDINDLEVIKAVGFGCSVSNGMDSVKKAAKYVTKVPGGSGAIREIAELILGGQR